MSNGGISLAWLFVTCIAPLLFLSLILKSFKTFRAPSRCSSPIDRGSAQERGVEVRLLKGKFMKTLQNYGSHLSTPSRRSRLTYIVMLSILTLLAFVLCGSGNLSSTAQAAQQAQVASASTATSIPIRVFFSKFPNSVDTDFSAVYPVDRVSPTVAVGTFAIQLLIAGPTISERNQGLFSELNTMLSGPSSCSAPLPVGGPDFTLTLNKKGSVTEQGTATLQFCRTISSPGIGADARVAAQINATLKQFSSIKKVVILTREGHCFGDESGRDFCLR